MRLDLELSRKRAQNFLELAIVQERMREKGVPLKENNLFTLFHYGKFQKILRPFSGKLLVQPQNMSSMPLSLAFVKHYKDRSVFDRQVIVAWMTRFEAWPSIVSLL